MPTVATSPAAPIRVAVSNDPPVRLAQMDGFFLRNPGFVRTEGVTGAIRGAVARIPGTRGMLELLEPTELGVGQLIHDQMQWQMDTSRQPANPWWMRMNHQLVSDPLTAEAYVRAGRTGELAGKGEQAWARYIELSDRVRALVGIEPGQTHVIARDGTSVPTAISDAWRGASCIDRVTAQALKQQARAALWQAHCASLEVGRAAAGAQAAMVEATSPAEAEFMSSWANFVNLYARANPLATGRQALWAQRHLLPDMGPIDPGRLTPLRRAFASVLARLDPHYEREIKGRTGQAPAALAA